MSIFIDNDTKLVVHGITVRDGSFHTRQMMEYGTQVVAGVTPGKGGQTFEGPDGKTAPIFNSMASVQLLSLHRQKPYIRLLNQQLNQPKLIRAMNTTWEGLLN